MTAHDPVDTLLRNAFAADLERTDAPPAAARVMRRIRRHQRIRRLTVTATLLAGLIVLAASVQPALAALAETLGRYLPPDLQFHGIALAVLAVLGAGWLMALDGDAAA